MRKNIFLAIGVFFAVFFGACFGVVAFFRKIKKKKSFKDFEAEKEDKDNIIDENTKEWEKL